MGVAAVVLIAVLVVALAAQSAALALVLRSRSRLRTELATLQESLHPAPRTGALEATGRVVRDVVRRAGVLREHGMSELLSSSLDDLLRWAAADRERIVRVADDDGVVTLFFSDITDSTALNERVGDDEWTRVLAAHDRLVRRGIEERDGLVVKTVGDGFMAVFPTAQAAVRAAVAIQEGLGRPRGRRLRRVPVSVRIGVHTGTAVSRDGDYLGHNVAVCARIAAHATGGQILTSAATRDAAAGLRDVTFRSEGEVAFKGVSEPVAVYTVSAG
ncbi:adenylate/guanylate cyclase [Jatrophihabitans endophyticus]|uniref:Adenylate/guanylate cyclase n=1 Tax=Jatrophihabitans endophyticus TaxID=1206085 RepID=A0A1M5CG86_9ACTN|nr:adenylate/guanylate cyclase domain-containing protein [Jatrophihabitans endophyticus]SHF53710.1 adenylate/guanylate cyclase [Jatrophihabitans endophyticus]